MLVHQILVKICRYSPGAILGSLDQILDPLDKEATKKVKDTQVREERGTQPLGGLYCCCYYCYYYPYFYHNNYYHNNNNYNPPPPPLLRLPYANALPLLLPSSSS